MATGFLGRVYRLGRNLLTYGLGAGSGVAPPPAPVHVPGCVTSSIESTATVTMNFESTASVTIAIDPTATITITFEGC